MTEYINENSLRLLTRDSLKDYAQSKGFTPPKVNINKTDLIKWYNDSNIYMSADDFHRLVNLIEEKRRVARKKYVDTRKLNTKEKRELESLRTEPDVEKKIPEHKLSSSIPCQDEMVNISNQELVMERLLSLLIITKLKMEVINLKYHDLKL